MGATRDSVAKKAGGVSSATVSRVYNNPPGQVSPPSLAKRVLEAASELGGYEPTVQQLPCDGAEPAPLPLSSSGRRTDPTTGGGIWIALTGSLVGRSRECRKCWQQVPGRCDSIL